MAYYNLHNSADMEKCKGDQPPEKNLIGPSLPLSESLFLDGQPDCPRPAMGSSEMFGSLVLSEPYQESGSGTTTGRPRRTNTDPCRDLEAQLKGCFEGPVLRTDFLFEEPVSVNDSPVKKIEAESQKSYEASVSHLPFVKEPYHLPTVSLETAAHLGSTSLLHAASLGGPVAPSFQDRGHDEKLAEVSHCSGDIQTCEQIPSCLQASDVLVMKSSPHSDMDLSLDDSSALSRASCHGGDNRLSPPSSRSPPPASYLDRLSTPDLSDLSLDTDTDSVLAPMSSSPTQQRVLDEGEQEAQWSNPSRVSIFEPGFCPEDLAQCQTPAWTATVVAQAPDDSAIPCSAQPDSPRPISVRDVDQIRVQVNVAAAGVKETVVIETEAEEGCDSRIDSEPLESCCLLVTDQPGDRAGEREGEEEYQEKNSAGCCFFSCFSSKSSKE